jgi:uncharacterized protein YjiS (DUF1127 family)
MRIAAIQSTASARSATPRPSLLKRLLVAGQAWLNRRAVLAELNSLDARTLDDLRIYRGDFQAIAEGTYIREGGAHDVALKPEAGTPHYLRRQY